MNTLDVITSTILEDKLIWQVGDGGHLEGNNRLVLNCVNYTHCFCGKSAGS